MASFEDQIKQFADEVIKKQELAVRKISLEIFTRVILKSPVDEGRFRGNWQVSIGNVPSGTVEIDDKSGSATISKAQAKALSLTAGQVIYLVNNLPYSHKLEYGHSNQAPNGMVRTTVQEFSGVVDQIAKELSKK